jgi:HK97 family phage major capsid protein
MPNWQPLVESVLASRLARGVGAVLLNGGQSITGLIPSLMQLGALVAAIGNSESIGGSQTAGNSIGISDLANVFTAVPEPYRNSPKFAFLMNSTTLAYLMKTLNKQGSPVVIDITQGEPKLWGKQILIDENMPLIGVGNYPVIAGDFSYWLTRSCPGSLYVKRYTQAAGLVEKGLFGISLFCREGGVLLYNDNPSFSPLWLLGNQAAS